jgi:hypothetical protein
MNIAILLDQFSGHLFHDVELFIVLFEKKIEISRLDFITTTKKNNFHSPTIIERNQILCKKLFGIPFTIVSEHHEYDMILDRFKLDARNINKAFATSICRFPTIQWANSFGPERKIDGLKILYSSRQSTTRKLTEDSHLFIMDLVKKMNGTICNDLTNIGIEEQIELFRNHNCVIGVHGNNLTGVMWMNPSCHVFEILPFHAKNIVYDYHCMSLCMKHHYTQINGMGKSHNSVLEIDFLSRQLLRDHIHMLYQIMCE